MAVLARCAASSALTATRRLVPHAPLFRARRIQHRHAPSVRLHAKRATESDEKLIEDMKRDAEKGDLLDGGAADVLSKVLIVAVSVGLVVWLVFLGFPVIQNTLAAFPSADR